MYTPENILTNDIYKLANENDVIIISEPLGNIHGYYHVIENQKMIHVNESLSETHRNITICKLIHSCLQGEQFVLLQSNDGESESDLLVHYVFTLFMIFSREIENFNEHTKKQVLNMTSTAYKQLLKMVS